MRTADDLTLTVFKSETGGRSVGCSQNSLTWANAEPVRECPQVKRGCTHSRSEAVSELFQAKGSGGRGPLRGRVVPNRELDQACSVIAVEREALGGAFRGSDGSGWAVKCATDLITLTSHRLKRQFEDLPDVVRRVPDVVEVAPRTSSLRRSQSRHSQ